MLESFLKMLVILSHIQPNTGVATENFSLSSLPFFFSGSLWRTKIYYESEVYVEPINVCHIMTR